MSEQEARDFLSALGAEIASWRRRRRLTRAQLAAEVDLSETTIGRIERGGTDAAVATSDVWRISSALGLSFSDLIGRAEEAERLAPATSGGAQAAARREDEEGPRLSEE